MTHHGSGVSSAAVGGLRGLQTALAGLGAAAGGGVVPHPVDAPRLGALSERYESGGRGAGTVSSGLRDPGGVSYGTYQLASKTGTVAAFLSAEGVRWSGRFHGKKPGSDGFSSTWKDVAAREGDAFALAQHAFIERSHYRPVVVGVKNRTGLDIDARAHAVRDVCWSCAVQHGGAIRILVAAIKTADARMVRTAPEYDRCLIEAIYDVRTDYVRTLAASAEPGARRTLLDIVARRYPDERGRALAMLVSAA